MAGTTARGAFPFPDGGDPPDTDGATRSLALALDAKVALDFQGLLADRPAAGIKGRYYAVIDGPGAGVLWRDTGASWSRVGADADTLDGLDSTAFAPAHAHPYYPAGSKVADSELLDGLDSTAFAPSRFARHFMFGGN